VVLNWRGILGRCVEDMVSFAIVAIYRMSLGVWFEERRPWKGTVTFISDLNRSIGKAETKHASAIGRESGREPVRGAEDWDYIADSLSEGFRFRSSHFVRRSVHAVKVCL
jgi:hypothetical protein